MIPIYNWIKNYIKSLWSCGGVIPVPFEIEVLPNDKPTDLKLNDRFKFRMSKIDYASVARRTQIKRRFYYDYKPQPPRTSEQIVRDFLTEDVSNKYSKIALRLLDEHLDVFSKTHGSSHNHQAWEGGYLDHIAQTMRIVNSLYDEWHDWQGEFSFSKSDAVLVMFLHDLDKPFVKSGQWPNHSKKARTIQKMAYIDQYFGRYGVKLTDDHWNALEFVEGEGDDYSSKRRVMGPLAALCHCADVMSSRIWFDFPKGETNEK